MAEENTMTARKQAARSKMTPRSRVWEHFTRSTDGDGKDKAECKRCRQVLGAETKSGTSTLWNHVKVCKRRESLDGAPGNSHPASSVPQLLLRARSGSDLDLDEPSGREPAGPEEEGSADLARMIALHGYDPSVVDDYYFRRFVRHLNPEFKVPSRHAIDEMCDAIFDETRKDVFSRLTGAPGRPSIAVGRVRAVVEGEVLYTSCHFIDDEWNLHRVIMDAYADLYFPDYHGPLLGVHDVTLCSDFHGMSIDKVMEDLSERDVLDNLFMMLWDTTKDDIHLELRNQIEEKRLSINTMRTGLLICTTFVDNLIHSIARRLTVSPNFLGDMGSDLLDLHLPREKRQQLLSQLGLDNNLWAYDEHWYSSYCSLEVLRREGSTLTDTESGFAELLCKLLREIYDAIHRISASSFPTSNLCLVELFKLMEVLQSQLDLASGDNAMAYKLSNGFLYHDEGKDVADVLREVIQMLDKAIKDSYLVWSIPVVLDPRYKLWHIDSLFKISFGSEASSYTSNVIKKIREIYSDYIQTNGGANGGDSDGNIVMTTVLEQQARMEHFHSQHGFSLELYNYRQAEKELDRYFDDPPVPMTAEGFDILNWWKVHSSVYPRVAQMARDALAMPTCSKLSSEQTSHVRSIVRGYSKKGFAFGVQQF